jgi:O-acetylhomoserine (thiol)-lyase
MFTALLKDIGVEVRFADSDHASAIDKLIDRNTCAVFCESVGNPAGNVCDIESLAEVAHVHGVPLVVDNTVATPILLRPIEWGADIVVHSLTKYMGGHGTTLAGAIVDSGKFPWSKYPERFPRFNQPEPSYHGMIYSERFGPSAYIERCRSYLQRITGAVLSPFNAFLILQGIETVALRVERHVQNAKIVAQYLQQHPKVAWVGYAGFEDNQYYALTQKYLGGHACALMTFGVRGGYEAGVRFYNALKLISRLVNLGDAKTLACHPASTTHRQMPPEALAKAGVSPDLIRLSIGIEHHEDIIADLDQALATC